MALMFRFLQPVTLRFKLQQFDTDKGCQAISSHDDDRNNDNKRAYDSTLH